MRQVGEQIIEALEELTESLESGAPIEAVRIRRINTPDGPAHIKEHVVISSDLVAADLLEENGFDVNILARFLATIKMEIAMDGLSLETLPSNPDTVIITPVIITPVIITPVIITPVIITPQPK